MGKRRSTTFKGDGLMSSLSKNLLKKTLAHKMAESSNPETISRQNSSSGKQDIEASRSSINSEKDKKMRRNTKARAKPSKDKLNGVGINPSHNKDINGELNSDEAFYKPVHLKQKEPWETTSEECTLSMDGSPKILSTEQQKIIREHKALEDKIDGLRRAKHEQELAKKRREAE
jgi:hypothetical protein